MATQTARDLTEPARRPPISRVIADVFDRVRSSGEHFLSQPRRAARRDGRGRGRGAERRSAALARGLGWFSLGLGVVELTAPGVIERAVGLRGRHRALLPAIGVREIVAGIGILSARRPLPLWLWARVAGDAMDLGLLLLAMRRDRDRDGKTRTATATAAVAGVTALDVASARRLERTRVRPEKPPRSIAVNRPLDECRRLWHAFSESPRFQRDFATLRSVDFEAGPAGRGTMIRVYMPTGTARAEHEAQEALRQFKQVVETGEYPTTRGQPAGPRSLIGKTLRRIETS